MSETNKEDILTAVLVFNVLKTWGRYKLINLLKSKESYNLRIVFNISFLNRRKVKLEEICCAQSENSNPKSVILFF